MRFQKEIKKDHRYFQRKTQAVTYLQFSNLYQIFQVQTLDLRVKLEKEIHLLIKILYLERKEIDYIIINLIDKNLKEKKVFINNLFNENNGK